MSSSPVKTLLLAALILGGGAYYMSLDEDAKVSGADILSGLTGKTTVRDADGNIVIMDRDKAERRAAERASRPAATIGAVQQSASVVSLPRTNGQFFTQGRVNTGSVRFLVDTGASTVALTLDDARRAGIDVGALDFSVPVDTANGRTYAASVRLKDVQIGGIRVRNVEGMVIAEGLHISLLGMTFLGELQKVEATPTQLIMRL